MEITCPRCQSLHEIEPPPSARARGPRSLKFRCSHCGHTFSVDPEAPKESTSPPPLGEKPSGESIQLVQVAGQIWSVPDMAALHQWILERRLDRDALVSKHGLRWVRAGEREDLAVFFSASDALSFQERNLRTEMPPHDEEIVVDAPEADDADGSDATSVGMPVATGPGPAVGGYPRGLGTVMMDFDGGDDTQEQTVRSDGLDETPIERVPASFDRAEPVSERTERMPPGTAARDIPLPAGISTVTPGPAPAGSAALGTPAHVGPIQGGPVHGGPAAVLPGPSVIAPAPLRVVPSTANHGPAPLAVTPAAPGGGPSVGRAIPPTLVPPPAPPAVAPVNPNSSQAFFLDGAPVSPAAPSTPRRDVFEDPPSSVSSGVNWPLWGGLAGVAAVAILAFAMWNGRGAASLAGTAAPVPAPLDAGAPAGAGTAAPAATPELSAGGTAAVEVPVGAGSATGTEGPASASSASAAPAIAAPASSVPAAPAVAKASEPSAGAGAGAVKAPAASSTAAPKGPATAKAPASSSGSASTGGSPKKLVEQGWKAVEAGDYTKAHGLFDRALQGGTGADALFGRGYANEKLGDGVSATDDYCRALNGGAVSIDMQREIEGGLRRLGRSCS